jgi:hypothetical protein
MGYLVKHAPDFAVAEEAELVGEGVLGLDVGPHQSVVSEAELLDAFTFAGWVGKGVRVQ